MRYCIIVLVLHSIAILQLGFGKTLNSQEQSLGSLVYNLTNKANHLENKSYASCKCDKGECVSEGGKYVCKCPPGFGNYTSTRCEECKCGPGANCIFTKNYGGKVCFCNPGFVDEYGKCVACTCENGKCIEEEGKTICKCPLQFGYYGGNKCKDCECGRGYSCIWGPGVFRDSKKCFCKPGYIEKGEECLGPCSPNPCENGGLCIDREGGYECLCPSEYTGKNCKYEATCVKNEDCKEYEICRNIDGLMTCKCGDGLGGKDCRNKDWCEDVNYFKNCKGVNGSCEFDPKERSVNCICQTGKEFHPIEKRCRDTCNSYNQCLNGGKCQDKFCSCNSGLYGDKCELIFDCTEGKYKGCHGSGGECKYVNNAAVCECPTDHKFDDKDNICKECNCGQYGECNFKNGKRICDCSPGYVEKDNKCIGDSCNPNPCKNGGYCGSIYDGEGFKCLCINNWKGMTCEKRDACYPNPCKNRGSCESIYDEEGFKCICNKDWRGMTCEINSTCDPDNCKNGGQCRETDDGNGHYCICDWGWVGDRCEINDPCNHADCYAGNCRSFPPYQKDDFKCHCFEHWEGIHCDIKNVCKGNVCLNGGTCISIPYTTDYICKCLENWKGKHCDIHKACRTDTCKNGGTCIEFKDDSGYICNCPRERSGKHCEIYRQCDPNPCRNGGECFLDGEKFRCVCYSGWEGQFCDESKACESRPCKNGGRCYSTETALGYSCKCIGIWEGDTCEKMRQKDQLYIKLLL